MKKSKLIKIIVFAVMFVLSLGAMTTLLCINKQEEPNIEVASAEITNISKFRDAVRLEYYVELKNTTNYFYNYKINIMLKLKNSDNILYNYYDSNNMYNQKIYNLSKYINTSTLNIDENALKKEDFEVLVELSEIDYNNDSDQPYTSRFIIAGLSLIPFVIGFGGILLYSIFEKDKK